MGRRRGRRRNRRRSRRGPSRSRRTTRRTTRRRAPTRRRVRRAAPKRRVARRAAPKRKVARKAAPKRRVAKKAAPKRKVVKRKVVNKKPAYRSRKQGLAANKKRIAAKRTRPSRRPAARKAAPAPKSRDQRMRDAARQRHANFKKTRVQTFGGTRKNYSKREAEKIQKAGLNFSKVTGGAKNPLARPPANPNVKPGLVMPQVQSFVDSLGLTNLDKNAAPMVNYNFSQRNTSLPSMGQLAKTDLSGFAKSVGADKRISGGSGSRNAFSARPDSNLNMRDLFQAKDLGNMTTNAINTMVDKIPIIGEKLPNIMPMSMTDRDRQKYLGYNPNKPSSYLKATDPGRPKGQRQGTGNYIEPEAMQQQFVEPEPVENTTVEESTPLSNLTEIQQDAYNTALQNYNAGTGYSGQGEGTGFGNLSQEVIAALMAGNRGQKRFRYGTARKRGSDSLLTRGSERFKGFTTTGQLNI